MKNCTKPATHEHQKIRRVIDLLFKVAMVGWLALFIGMLVSFGLVITGKAYTPAAAVAGYLFVGGAAGFIAGMLPVGLLSVAVLATPGFIKSRKLA